MVGEGPARTRIRNCRAADAPALADLYRRAVAAIGPRHYGEEQVRAWLSIAPDAARLRDRLGDGRTVLVAVDAADRPVAFADLESNGHIDLLYAAPEAAGTGVAGALLDRLEVLARARGVRRLTVEASEAARRLLHRRGFRTVARRELSIVGVAIHNFAMEKVL